MSNLGYHNSIFSKNTTGLRQGKFDKLESETAEINASFHAHSASFNEANIHDTARVHNVLMSHGTLNASHGDFDELYGLNVSFVNCCLTNFHAQNACFVESSISDNLTAESINVSQLTVDYKVIALNGSFTDVNVLDKLTAVNGSFTELSVVNGIEFSQLNISELSCSNITVDSKISSVNACLSDLSVINGINFSELNISELSVSNISADVKVSGINACFTDMTVADDCMIKGDLYLGSQSDNNINMRMYHSSNGYIACNSGDLRFRYKTNDRMILQSSGELGINTTSPEAKLHVIGDSIINSVSCINCCVTELSSVNACFTNLTVADNIGFTDMIAINACMTNMTVENTVNLNALIIDGNTSTTSLTVTDGIEFSQLNISELSCSNITVDSTVTSVNGCLTELTVINGIEFNQLNISELSCSNITVDAKISGVNACFTDISAVDTVTAVNACLVGLSVSETITGYNGCFTSITVINGISASGTMNVDVPMIIPLGIVVPGTASFGQSIDVDDALNSSSVETTETNSQYINCSSLKVNNTQFDAKLFPDELFLDSVSFTSSISSSYMFIQEDVTGNQTVITHDEIITGSLDAETEVNTYSVNSSNVYMQNTHYNILMDYNDMQLSSSNTSDFCVIKRNELNIQKRNGGIVYQSIINASNLDIYNISASLVNVSSVNASDIILKSDNFQTELDEASLMISSLNGSFLSLITEEDITVQQVNGLETFSTVINSCLVASNEINACEVNTDTINVSNLYIDTDINQMVLSEDQLLFDTTNGSYTTQMTDTDIIIQQTNGVNVFQTVLSASEISTNVINNSTHNVSAVNLNSLNYSSTLIPSRVKISSSDTFDYISLNASNLKLYTLDDAVDEHLLELNPNQLRVDFNNEYISTVGEKNIVVNTSLVGDGRSVISSSLVSGVSCCFSNASFTGLTATNAYVTNTSCVHIFSDNASITNLSISGTFAYQNLSIENNLFGNNACFANVSASENFDFVDIGAINACFTAMTALQMINCCDLSVSNTIDTFYLNVVDVAATDIAADSASITDMDISGSFTAFMADIVDLAVTDIAADSASITDLDISSSFTAFMADIVDLAVTDIAADNVSITDSCDIVNKITAANGCFTDVTASNDLNAIGNIVSGIGSGGVALTINDGKGNANVTFNHTNGVPEQTGNSGRIEVNTDATGGQEAAMYFELKSVSEAVSTDLDIIMSLKETSGMTVDANACVTGYTSFGENVHLYNVCGSSLFIGPSVGDTGDNMRLINTGTASYIQTSVGKLYFRYQNSIKMTMDPNGQFGIGTLTPSAQLDVVGDTELNGDCTITGDISAVNACLTDVTASSRLNAVGYVIAGLGSGGVALTHNDGYGNANLTFNHTAGTPEQTGRAGRIEVNTDGSGATEAYMDFELKSVSDGVTGSLNSIMRLQENSGMTVYKNATFNGDLTVDTDTLYVDSTNDRVGINESSPVRALDVVGTALITDSNGRYLNIGQGTTTGLHHFDYYSGATQTNPFYINYYSGEDTIINGNGGSVRLGGTGTTSDKLRVQGDATVDDTLTVTTLSGTNACLTNADVTGRLKSTNACLTNVTIDGDLDIVGTLKIWDAAKTKCVTLEWSGSDFVIDTNTYIGTNIYLKPNNSVDINKALDLNNQSILNVNSLTADNSTFESIVTDTILVNDKLRIPVDTSNPTSPGDGQVYFNTTSNEMKVYKTSGAEWRFEHFGT